MELSLFILISLSLILVVSGLTINEPLSLSLPQKEKSNILRKI